MTHSLIADAIASIELAIKELPEKSAKEAKLRGILDRLRVLHTQVVEVYNELEQLLVDESVP